VQVLVLGAAAGGGFPQWNSNAEACRRARAGDPLARPRTQASITVSADGRNWFILNASPDLRQQIGQNRRLHPVTGLRSSPIAGVVLTNGDVDAIAGLLTLRERQKFTIYAPDSVLAVLAANPVFDVLARDIVLRTAVSLDRRVALALPDGTASGLECELFAVPGKIPLYLEGAAFDASAPPSDSHTVGAMITDGDRVLYFVPACAAVRPALLQRVEGSDALFFDGTLWADDEMVRAGLGPKTGRRMGHVSVSGPDGVLSAFETSKLSRKILIHINNSNPILIDDTPERALVAAAGWEVAYDGMEFAL
jgi:pyrroloquinoline quinone biosynthesis protein B